MCAHCPCRQITRTLGRLEKGHSVQAALMSMMDVHNRNKGLETEKEGLMQELQRQRNQLQSKDLTSLKQDLAFMHKSRDLLKVRKEDKGMRRQLVRLNKKEQAKHDSLDEKEREAALKEEKRVMEKLGLQVHDQTPATPSLWAMVRPSTGVCMCMCDCMHACRRVCDDSDA